jgi:hypothetical protein
MLRLMWLRRDHPEAAVSTEAVEIEDNLIVIRAAISLGNGAAGSGLSATHLADEQEWPAAVERTETTAIARALDTLGYLLEASMAREPETTAPQPRPQRPEPEPARLQAVPTQQEPGPTPASSPGSQPAPATTAPEPRESGPTPPIVDALRRANRRPVTPVPPAPTPITGPGTSAPAEDEDHLEDYSWTAFWSRARALGLDKSAIETRLGRSTQGMSPLELRIALEESGVDFGGSSGS